jgi:hypothetical protein
MPYCASNWKRIGNSFSACLSFNNNCLRWRRVQSRTLQYPHWALLMEKLCRVRRENRPETPEVRREFLTFPKITWVLHGGQLYGPSPPPYLISFTSTSPPAWLFVATTVWHALQDPTTRNVFPTLRSMTRPPNCCSTCDLICISVFPSVAEYCSHIPFVNHG